MAKNIKFGYLNDVYTIPHRPSAQGSDAPQCAANRCRLANTLFQKPCQNSYHRGESHEPGRRLRLGHRPPSEGKRRNRGGRALYGRLTERRNKRQGRNAAAKSVVYFFNFFDRLFLFLLCSFFSYRRSLLRIIKRGGSRCPERMTGPGPTVRPLKFPLRGKQGRPILDAKEHKGAALPNMSSCFGAFRKLYWAP